MNGKIILNIAMSLDGYIAREDDTYDWIVGHGDKKLNTENTFDYVEWLNSIDVVAMGKRCFDLNMHQEFKDKEILIATHSKQTNHANIYFTNDLINRLTMEKNKGKNIYLFGGGKVIEDLIKKELIDEYIIGIVPSILGEGIPLFYPHKNATSLKLIENYIDNGIVIMKYVKA